MLDSIFTGMTGLQGFSQGLKTIANNTANMNTPGFKGRSQQFADLFYANGNLGGRQGAGQRGFGLDTRGTTFDFSQGELRNTGNDLDLAINGLGLFTFRDTAGKLFYSRAGQFQFDADGVLVNRIDRSHVMGLGSGGSLQTITTKGLQVNPPVATRTVRFSGNVSSTTAGQTVNQVTVTDSKGGSHALTLQLTNANPTLPGEASTWNVSILEGATSIGSGTIGFISGRIDPARARISVPYAPAGAALQLLNLDFSGDVTSLASGNLSTLAMASQDGRSAGTLVKSSFDAAGFLTLSYSNGQTVQGARLAISVFDTPDAVVSVGGQPSGRHQSPRLASRYGRRRSVWRHQKRSVGSLQCRFVAGIQRTGDHATRLPIVIPSHFHRE